MEQKTKYRVHQVGGRYYPMFAKDGYTWEYFCERQGSITYHASYSSLEAAKKHIDDEIEYRTNTYHKYP